MRYNNVFPPFPDYLKYDVPSVRVFTSGLRVSPGNFSSSYGWCPQGYLGLPTIPWLPGEPDITGKDDAVVINFDQGQVKFEDVSQLETLNFMCEVRST